MTGDMTFGRNITTAKIINNPYFSDMSWNLCFVCTGKNAKSIFDPSSGGIGIKLKTARLTFIRTTKLNILIRGIEEKLKCNNPLIIRPKIIATRRFDAGPAIDIRGSATFLFFKLCGLYGTGLAQPIIKPACVIARARGKITEPNQSRCLRGFRVSLPSYCAVLSPKQRAVKP
ncbi:MAG: hypothetical protein ABIF22_01690 [bacterium]